MRKMNGYEEAQYEQDKAWGEEQAWLESASAAAEAEAEALNEGNSASRNQAGEKEGKGDC